MVGNPWIPGLGRKQTQARVADTPETEYPCMVATDWPLAVLVGGSGVSQNLICAWNKDQWNHPIITHTYIELLLRLFPNDQW